MPFTCSICAEESTRICVRCTKDSCNNHLCDKCFRCSDCCECEVALSETPRPTVRPVHWPVEGEDVEDDDLLDDDLEDEDDDEDEDDEAAVPPAEPAPVPVPAETTPQPSET